MSPQGGALEHKRGKIILFWALNFCVASKLVHIRYCDNAVTICNLVAYSCGLKACF